MLSRRHFLQGVAVTAAGLSTGTTDTSTSSAIRVAPTPGEPIGDTLREAIKKARPTGRIELVFPAGEHIIADTPASTGGPHPGTFAAELEFDGFDQVIIRGEGAGADLLFSDFQRGAFRFLHCDSVTVSNVRIDWPRPPFSTAEVTASNGADIEVRVDNDFSLDQLLTVTSVVRYDPDTHAPSPVPDAVMYYHLPPENTTFIEPQRLRITLPETRDLPPGALLSLQHAQYGFDGFHFWHCRHVHVADTTVHTCPGMAFHGHSCHNLTMHRCNVVPSRRQQRRLHSSTADGSHFVNFSGRVELDRCTFTNTGDDCNNTWGVFMYVVDRISPRELRITHQGTTFMFPQQ
ncbi:MAG: twin-arginine translocation signal domain-containing protein, partial [Nitrospiraceae bacterium]|nr:twin-arginine translocation signal domain-containing protein [Nitrospiraceae bacterium]